MDYAQIDNNNRIISWCTVITDECTVPFSNGEYIDQKCVNGLQDFVILDGVAHFEPLPKVSTAEDDLMGMLIDQEFRLTMLELGL